MMIEMMMRATDKRLTTIRLASSIRLRLCEMHSFKGDSSIDDDSNDDDVMDDENNDDDDSLWSPAKQGSC